MRDLVQKFRKRYRKKQRQPQYIRELNELYNQLVSDAKVELKGLAKQDPELARQAKLDRVMVISSDTSGLL